MFFYFISLIFSVDHLLSKHDRLPTEELFKRIVLRVWRESTGSTSYYTRTHVSQFMIFHIIFYYLKFNWFILFHVKFRNKKRNGSFWKFYNSLNDPRFSSNRNTYVYPYSDFHWLSISQIRRGIWCWKILLFFSFCTTIAQFFNDVCLSALHRVEILICSVMKHSYSQYFN